MRAHRSLGLFVLALATGCGGARVIELHSFSLQVEGAPEASPVELPAHLDVPSHPCRYTLTTAVQVPPAWQGKTLDLNILVLPARVTLLVDGVELPSLTAEPWDVYRTAGSARWQIPADKVHGTLELELRVEHRWVASAWVDTAPRLSLASGGDARFAVLHAINVGTAALTPAALLTVTPLYLLIFFRDRRRRAHGWFGVQSVMAAFYPCFSLGLTQIPFGTRDIAVTMLAVLGCVLSSIYFLHARLELRRPPSALWLTLAAISLPFIFLVGPFTSLTLSMPVVALALLGNIGYHVLVLMREHGKRARAALLPTACWVLVGALGWTDCAAGLGFGGALAGIHLASLSVLLFLVVQAVSLGAEHASSLRRAEELNFELSTRLKMIERSNHEVQVLNEELRRQIGNRSRQLSLALARLTSGASAPSGQALRSGALIGEQYRVVQALGAGAMGSVYEVERLTDGKYLAAKIIRGNTNAAALARFAREAEIASTLDHPNVVGVFDIDVTSSGELFLVMELVKGTTLEAERSHFGDPSWSRPILLQIARALDAIHKRGVVHRDLKPSNVLVTSDREVPLVKLADFGISSLRNAEALPQQLLAPAPTNFATGETIEAVIPANANLTREGVLLGTPLYMAPELIEGAKDARSSSDMFSFGILAYELLTGKMPFVDPPVVQRLQGRIPSAPPPLADACPSISAELGRLIDSCLRMDPAARPQAGEVVASFARA